MWIRYSPENRQVIEENARKLKIPIEIFESDIFDAVYTIENPVLSVLCSHAPRTPFTLAKQLGCNKIALGHHATDDVIETILMGMLYGA